VMGRNHLLVFVSENQLPTIGANVRALRQGMGWTQRHLAELLGWGPDASSVCRLEKETKDGRRRNITMPELERLADIFDVAVWQLKARCVICDGNPPTGFACLTCGARASVGAG
jgi:transcriptional regulator with XRE-family HTH domain